MRNRIALSALLVVIAALALGAAACGGTTPSDGATSGSPVAKEATGPLNLLLWEGYASDELVKGFQDQYPGVKVNVAYIGSNDEVFAKIRTKSNQYDLIPATTDVSMQYIDAGLVQPIDLANITNYSAMFPTFQNLAQAEKDGVVYGVAHTWSADPILYNADVVKNPEQSYKILWDEQYSGKISMYDDIGSLWVGAIVDGYPPFTLQGAEMDAVVKTMEDQKPLIRKYWSTGNDLVNLFESGEVTVATGWNYMYTQLKADGMNVGRISPSEGNLGWVDTLLVPLNAKNPYTAQLWIDWAISGKGGSYTAKASGYSISNPAINEFLTPEEITDLHMDDPAFIDKIILWQPVDRPVYQDAWNQVKAAQ